MPPIRAAFYYPWFPETWGSGTIYQPSLGNYSTTRGIIQTHIAEMRYARCRAAIASWWGPGTPYDRRMLTCLDAAAGSDFKFCVYYEKEGYENPTSLGTDLAYVWSEYANHPNYLHVNRKPVIFAYADPSDGPAMVDRWLAANAGRFYLNLKLFTGYQSVPQPDSWHQYAPANNAEDHSPYAFSVSPGFAKPGETVRLARDPSRFRRDVDAMVASDARWHLITTFNEWGEGTAIEPELEWGNTYLDILAGH